MNNKLFKNTIIMKIKSIKQNIKTLIILNIIWLKDINLKFEVLFVRTGEYMTLRNEEKL